MSALEHLHSQLLNAKPFDLDLVGHKIDQYIVVERIRMGRRNQSGFLCLDVERGRVVGRTVYKLRRMIRDGAVVEGITVWEHAEAQIAVEKGKRLREAIARAPGFEG